MRLSPIRALPVQPVLTSPTDRGLRVGHVRPARPYFVPCVYARRLRLTSELRSVPYVQPAPCSSTASEHPPNTRSRLVGALRADPAPLRPTRGPHRPAPLLGLGRRAHRHNADTRIMPLSSTNDTSRAPTHCTRVAAARPR